MTALAQSGFLIVKHKDGSEVLFALSESPKVSYAGDIVSVQAGTTVQFPFQSIWKMTFTDDDTYDIRMPEDPEIRPFHIDGHTVCFYPIGNDLKVRIVTVNGMVINEALVKRGEYSRFSFSTFPSGVYLMDVNGITYKIAVP